MSLSSLFVETNFPDEYFRDYLQLRLIEILKSAVSVSWQRLVRLFKQSELSFENQRSILLRSSSKKFLLGTVGYLGSLHEGFGYSLFEADAQN